MWGGAAVVNKPFEAYNLAAWGANVFRANLPYAPTMQPDQRTSDAGRFFYYGTNIGFAFQGGASALSRSFGTRPNQAVFWSGFPEARTAATSFAKITDGKTIEMTLGGRTLNLFSPTVRSISRTVDDWLWRRASKSFANHASGTANVFVRFPIDVNRTWKTVEEPILRARGINFQLHLVK